MMYSGATCRNGHGLSKTLFPFFFTISKKILINFLAQTLELYEQRPVSYGAALARTCDISSISLNWNKARTQCNVQLVHLRLTVIVWSLV